MHVEVIRNPVSQLLLEKLLFGSVAIARPPTTTKVLRKEAHKTAVDISDQWQLISSHLLLVMEGGDHLFFQDFNVFISEVFHSITHEHLFSSDVKFFRLVVGMNFIFFALVVQTVPGIPVLSSFRPILHHHSTNQENDFVQATNI